MGRGCSWPRGERGFSSSNAASTASARAASPSSIASAHCSWPTPRNSCAIPSWSRTRERSIARRKSVTIRSSTRAAYTARSCDRRAAAMPTLDAPRALQSSQRIWDKQPEMTGWRQGLSPWQPVREGDKLYGRGGADDGYSSFASLAAIRLVQEQKLSHARCVVLIEACEESGSTDLPAYIEHLAARIGKPSLVVCLDSGCGNYEQLWMTTSLRGLVSGNLRVDILTEGVHSGDASGIVPESFRILRQLLSRIDDEQTGRVKIDGLQVQIPGERLKQARLTAEVLGDEVWNKFPFVPGARPSVIDRVEMILNRSWRPALSITGAEGLPPLESAGSVLRPFTACKISLRIPPRIDPVAATRA